MLILLSFLVALVAPKRALGLHLGVGFGSAFMPATFTIHTKNTKSFFAYFANVPDVGVMRIFEMKGPFYTGVGGHASLGLNMLSAGPAIATGARFDIWVVRLSAEYLFLANHRGIMEGTGVLEVGVGW